MHEIGTVTTSLVFRELQRHRDTVEASLCAVRPYWIFPRRSKNGWWSSCGRPLAVVRTGQIGTGKLTDILFGCSSWSPHPLLTSQAPLVIQIPQATRGFPC